MCVTDPWAHMNLVHSILSLKLGVTTVNTADILVLHSTEVVHFHYES